MLAVYVPHITTCHISGSFVKAISNLVSMRWHKAMKGGEGGSDGGGGGNRQMGGYTVGYWLMCTPPLPVVE